MDSLKNSRTDRNFDNQSEKKNNENLGSLTTDDYVRIIRELEEREARLTEEIKEIRLKEENARTVSEKFRLLGDLTTEMLDLDDLKDVYNYIPDSVILFNSIDENEKTVKLESISGIKNRLLNKVLNT